MLFKIDWMQDLTFGLGVCIVLLMNTNKSVTATKTPTPATGAHRKSNATLGQGRAAVVKPVELDPESNAAWTAIQKSR